ncbi:MAG TPA: thiamine diphosphokinase [Oligoflexia bacterium]|nr:thiamine diphosphokinase [Oligoflexia bacterium]HMR24746.1 thiamine diphosphokinase [Oligoflexia bacterium]
MQQSVLIIANHVFDDLEFLQQQLQKFNTVICCDGAANDMKKINFIPTLIIGDLDSLSSESRDFFQDKVEIIHKPSQYQCDLEKALDYCVDKGYKNVNLIGLEGGRADYAIANFIVLKHYCEQLNLKVIGKDYLAFPVIDHWQKKCEAGQILSFIPFGHCEGINLKGLKYALENTSMKLGDIGVSNEVTQEDVRISIKSGYACVFLFNKK